jgi:4-hydroxy-tetrahydrodipicolinate synthase
LAIPSPAQRGDGHASNHSTPSGLWLPLITPFRDGELDEMSLRRLVKHYAGERVEGFVLGAITGEALTPGEDEAGQRRVSEQIRRRKLSGRTPLAHALF